MGRILGAFAVLLILAAIADAWRTLTTEPVFPPVSVEPPPRAPTETDSTCIRLDFGPTDDPDVIRRRQAALRADSGWVCTARLP